ncbi:MAG: family 10 glycosylhydrolase, partial [Gemmatimonadaceae bacterium]
MTAEVFTREAAQSSRTLRRLASALLVGLPLVAQAQAADLAPTRGLPYAPLGADAAVDTVAPPMTREFRAIWVASVSNIDWPSRPGLSTDAQKRELLALLDRAQALRMNAIVLQVRPSADALYASKLEPWSYFLTGEMGRAPSPFYDPLEFAVDEAHKRGLELHAWFNPYRAKDPSDRTPTLPRSHVSRTRPELVKKYGGFLWMDPGEPDIRRQTLEVVLDVVKRYDVDGIHIDDYFYPYPIRGRSGDLPFPDVRSWAAYKKLEGTLSRDDWRRQNVDVLVRELYEGIKKAKPWVKFGISPFGIWRPGFPQSVRGLDAYDKLYADSRKWLNEGWLDYWTPQLYWKLGATQQPYADLLAWWRAQNLHARHVWPGNFTGRASANRKSLWPVSEIIAQIRETRSQLSSASGNVHFSMDAFRINVDSLNERLIAGVYAEPALVPS